MSKLSPFYSKAKETSRNLLLIAEKASGVAALIEQVSAGLTDLIILADEIDLQEGELESIATKVQAGSVLLSNLKAQADKIEEGLKDADSVLFSDSGMGKLSEREVVKPYAPIFNYDASKMAAKVASIYYAKRYL